jgi:hypothetical protein
MISEAGISSDKKYRWWLFRCWAAHLPLIIWIMMNPSTADHQKNDPTILKIIRYSKKWGYGAVLVLNIYAFRSSRPENLPRVMKDAVGKTNDWWIRTIFRFAVRKKIPVICAWGVKHKERGAQIRVVADEAGLQLMCLELALNAEPKHPRFLSEDLRPRPLQSKRR